MVDGFCGVRYRFFAALEIAEFEGGGEIVELEEVGSTSLRIRTCRWISGDNLYALTVFPSYIPITSIVQEVLGRVPGRVQR